MGSREDLLVAARKCLEEKGYSRTTARDLAAASGANLASIGYHFGSKDALLNEAIVAAFGEWNESIRSLTFADPDATTLERLVTALHAICDQVRQNRPLLVAFTEAMAQVDRSPQVRERLAAGYGVCRDRVVEQVSMLFPTDDPKPVRTLASVFIALFDGLALQQLLDPDSVPTGDELVAALAQAGSVLAADLAP